MTPASPDAVYDLAVIGGGVNGCGIARDAAGRGLSVYLCEQDDLASGTSCASTKLVHGGLRYLEHYEFRLVREALGEREKLWKIAPHIIWPLRFVLPHHEGLRPAWLLRLGLFLYDHLGGRKLLPATKTLDLRADEAGRPLKPGYGKAFEYSDCWVEDSRLVVLNAMDARARGARIETRHALVSAERGKDEWTLSVRDAAAQADKAIRARAIVNAAGPWVSDVLTAKLRANAAAHVRLVRGSHIVVRSLFGHGRCYIFQNADGRIIFAIPYEREFTLIGTTDVDHDGAPGEVKATTQEIAYLCAAASEYFAKPIAGSDVVWTYSGVRPLYDDGASAAQAATRDYVLVVDAEAGAPMLSVFGGKITTYRRLAEHALEKLDAFLPAAARGKPGWTADAALPGGDFDCLKFDALVAEIGAAHPYLAPAHATRLARAYGRKAFEVLEGSRSAADLGQVFAADLTQAEVLYLMRAEWAREAADVLWRRSKLGLHATQAQAAALDAFMRAR